MTETDMCYPMSWDYDWLPPTTSKPLPIHSNHFCSMCKKGPFGARLEVDETYTCIACLREKVLHIHHKKQITLPLDVLTHISHYCRTWTDLINFARVSRDWCTSVNRDLEGEESLTMTVKTILMQEELWYRKCGLSDAGRRYRNEQLIDNFVQSLRLAAIHMKWVDPTVTQQQHEYYVMDFVTNPITRKNFGMPHEARSLVIQRPTKENQSQNWIVKVEEPHTKFRFDFEFDYNTGMVVSEMWKGDGDDPRYQKRKEEKKCVCM
eukprot:PhF_6_TR8523/c0_g1_i7/m.13354